MHGFETAMTEDRVNKGWQAAVQRPRPPWRPFQDPARQWLNAANAALPYRDEEMRSYWQLQEAKKWMSERAKDGPFALWFSIQEPHSPFDFPSDDQARFAAASFRGPQLGPEDGSQIPLIFRDLSEAEKTGIAAAYYSSSAYLDRNMGRILEHLRVLKLEENTLVVYMADHGYCLGQHGRFEKHCFYEPAMRVPLVFRYPGKVGRGKVVRRQTESVDVGTTILGLLSAEHRFDQTHGRNLFEGPAREDVFSIYLENEEACLIWREWKLIYTTGRRKRMDGYETDNPTPGKLVRLYDRRNDPGEFRNVASQHLALVQTLTHRLEQRFQATHPEGALALDDLLRPRDV